MTGFMLFAGDQYYAQGGWADYRGSFGSLAEAMNAVEEPMATNYAEPHRVDWAHIVHGGGIVAEAGKDYRDNHTFIWEFAAEPAEDESVP